MYRYVKYAKGLPGFHYTHEVVWVGVRLGAGSSCYRPRKLLLLWLFLLRQSSSSKWKLGWVTHPPGQPPHPPPTCNINQDHCTNFVGNPIFQYTLFLFLLLERSTACTQTFSSWLTHVLPVVPELHVVTLAALGGPLQKDEGQQEGDEEIHGGEEQGEGGRDGRGPLNSWRCLHYLFQQEDSTMELRFFSRFSWKSLINWGGSVRN